MSDAVETRGNADEKRRLDEDTDASPRGMHRENQPGDGCARERTNVPSGCGATGSRDDEM